MSTVSSPGSTAEAREMLRAVMSFYRASAAEMVTEEQAECLQDLEQVDSMTTATRAVVLGSFISGRGYSADADYSPRSWLIHRTRITKGAATAHTAWARRADAHPLVAAALAEGYVLSESYARKLCGWTDKLPEDCREAADAILVAAARAGADQQDLVELAMEIYTRSLPADPDHDPDDGFEDRQVRIETTLGGAGVLSGDLTPECSAVITAVLDALSAPVDAEDTRTHGQRYHDALADAMKRLLASGLLPERAGQPVKGWVHVSLAELRVLDDGSVLEGEWITAVRVRWAARRAAASEGASDGAAWLEGAAAEAATCDATLAPVVTGDTDLSVLDDLVRLCVELDRLDHGAGRTDDGAGRTDDGARSDSQASVSPSREALQQAIIGKTADLLSGPGGLASFLRINQLGARLAGPSLPLDIGYSKTIPPGIRNAVILRDRRCRWPGGCNQPAKACEVHHVKHKAHGGPTSLTDCVLLCSYHHQVVIHRWGWTLVLNPDGTTTAWNPGRTKVMHSHGPPTARAC